MSDFAQAGLICTLQRLSDAHGDRIEAELCAHAAERPVTLVLPCHAADLAQPALARIVEEVGGAKFIREVIVSTNGLDDAAFARAGQLFAPLPQPHRILRTDTARAAESIERLCERAVEAGKGLNVWAAAGLVVAEARSAVVVTQDCDVASFRRENLARLCFAAVHPDLRYDFAKMYYSRATDRLYGRVSRLFLAPLLQALVRTAGHRPLLGYLQSFRYPLAGECAVRSELAGALPMHAGWGLEIGLVCECFRRTDPRRIAQVDGGSDYEHRHHPLGGESGALFRMSREIALALLPQLAEEGVPFDAPFLAALAASFERESREALRRFHHLALINGLTPAPEEEAATTFFARALAEAGREFLTAAAPIALPAWEQLIATRPSDVERFLAAVVAAP